MKNQNQKIWKMLVVSSVFLMLMTSMGAGVLYTAAGTGGRKSEGTRGGRGDTIYVDAENGNDTTGNGSSGSPYRTIQKGINESADGDIILVKPGTYSENVKVNKSITIRSTGSPDDTIVNASNPDENVFELTEDQVNISGFMIKGSTTKSGIYINGFWQCGISGNNVSGNYYGIQPVNSYHNTIINNTVSSNSRYGIYLQNSRSNMLENNSVSDNHYGVYLRSSEDTTLTNNTLFENKYNFGVSDVYDQNIDTTNTVNGKPIYYWVNEHDRVIPNDAGYAGIVDSENITVRNLTLMHNGQGVLFSNTVNSRIENVNISNNEGGIYLTSSNNNNLTNSTVNSNTGNGLDIEYSDDNSIINNTVNSNTAYGLDIEYSDGISIINNTVKGNYYGIYLSYSDKTNITNNTIASSSVYGIVISSSNHNNLQNNSVNNNGMMSGIELYFATDNKLINNTITANKYGLYLMFADKNLFTKNIVTDNNNAGISLTGSDNIIYNNYFDNRKNVFIPGIPEKNIWNISKKEGRNIVGGSYLGGNYWDDYDGEDDDRDGLGDTAYVIEDDSNRDELPLIPNRLPIPEFNFTPSYPIIGQEIEFNASNSTDPDGSIAEYDWEFGDGTGDSGKMVKHSYSSEGKYLVNLTVTDNKGAKNTTNKTAVVYIVVPPFIIDFSPSPVVNIYVEKNQTFWIKSNQRVNVSWQIDGEDVQRNNSVLEASYTNMSAKMGLWNVSAAVENENGTDMQTWEFQVIDFTMELAGQMGGVANCIGIDENYAYLGESKGINIINISGEPQIAASLELPDDPMDIFVDAGYLYVADGEGGLQIVNVSNPLMPETAGSYENFSGSAHGVFKKGNFTHIAVPGQGVIVVNVSDNSNPTFVNSYAASAEDVFISDV